MWVYTLTAQGRELVELPSGGRIAAVREGVRDTFHLVFRHSGQPVVLAEFENEAQCDRALHELAARSQAVDMSLLLSGSGSDTTPDTSG